MTMSDEGDKSPSSVDDGFMPTTAEIVRVVPRQRSAPSATLAQLAELTSGRRHACELADAETF
jgi:hypothetical protein